MFSVKGSGVGERRQGGLRDCRAPGDEIYRGARHHGNVHAVIAHSLGGPAAALAIARGLPAARAVLVSPPSDLVGYSRRFAHWLAIPERVRRAMQAAIEERFGVRWSDLEIARIAPRLRAEALVIHDRQDTQVPWKQGVALARQWPGARLMSTRGLGHGRILESDITTRAAVDFIAGKSEVASPAAPALPQPAPLY